MHSVLVLTLVAAVSKSSGFFVASLIPLYFVQQFFFVLYYGIPGSSIDLAQLLLFHPAQYFPDLVSVILKYLCADSRPTVRYDLNLEHGLVSANALHVTRHTFRRRYRRFGDGSVNIMSRHVNGASILRT